MTGPLASDDPDGEAGDAQKDGDGDAQSDDEAEVGDDDTDTVSREVARSTHPPGTASPLVVLPGAELSSVSWRRVIAGSPLVLSAVWAAGGPGGPGAPAAGHSTELVTLLALLGLPPTLSAQPGGRGVVADPLPPPLPRAAP